MARVMVPCKHPGLCGGSRQHVAGSQKAKDCAAGVGVVAGARRSGTNTGVPAPSVSVQAPTDDPTKESWEPGEVAHFEYHCLESAESSDAELWYRSHRQVTVLGRNPVEPGWEDSIKEERGEEGMPFTYKVCFPDGHEGDVWEDELMTDPKHWYRPDPPNRMQDSIDDVSQLASKDRVAAMLDTEFGGNFNPHSLSVSKDGSSASLSVRDSFGYKDSMFQRGDRVTFDPRLLPDDIDLKRV